ncbi:MAG: hypothetical protein F6K19_49820 [Cyanothece sp. SIO1E1]|nr:hypothetical protein [Cyanothece sp. SIO1E1]
MTVSSPADPALDKLVAVQADITAQELALRTQLDAIQEKRQSLQAVIEMFSASKDLAVPDQTTVTPSAKPESQVAPPSKAAAPKTSKPRKQDKGKKTDWHRYLKAEFGETPLPAIVTQVLERQSNQALEISAIVDSILDDDTPNDAYSKGYARISNILSEGARQGRWYRQKSGKVASYSKAQKAVGGTATPAKQPRGSKALVKNSQILKREPAITLTLPRNFGKSITNQYEPTLDRLLPSDSEKRSAYLNAIAQETEAGKDFLMKIAKALTKKYKGRPGMIPAYRGLLDKAKAMQQSVA